MAFSKRSYKRKYKRRRKYKGKTKSNNQLSKDVALIRNVVRKVTPPKQYVTQEYAGTNGFTTAARVVLTNTWPNLPTSPGTNYVWYGFTIRGQCKVLTANASDFPIRFVVVIDKRRYDNDVAPVWTDIFHKEKPYSLRTSDNISAVTKDKVNSFKVILDKTYYNRNTQVGGNEYKQIHLSYRWPKGLTVRNNAAYQKNQTYLFMIAQCATGEALFDWEIRNHLQKNA